MTTEKKQAELNQSAISKEWLMSYAIVPLIGSIFITIFFCEECVSERSVAKFTTSTTISYVYWIAISLGNNLIVDFLNKYYDWLNQTLIRTILSLVVLLVYTCVITFVMTFLVTEILYGNDFWSLLRSGRLNMSLLTTILITVFISLFFHARGFFIRWRNAAVQNEKLNTENVNAKLETLKNQVNPHFLFNSLNALTSLVYDDQKKAVDFIHKLSDVYRYVLQNQGNELVKMQEELNFVEAFIYLNQIRFGENFEVVFENFDSLDEELHLPPLVLQMLVENGIKHNEISQERQLKMSIVFHGDYIIVKNNINSLDQEKADSTGLGLQNIVLRYSYFTPREVVVDDDQGSFSVSVPVLKLDVS